jgi:hypothetical protein
MGKLIGLAQRRSTAIARSLGPTNLLLAQPARVSQSEPFAAT